MTKTVRDITDKVADMYSQYPYPLIGNHSDFFFTWVYDALIESGKNFNRILDAGCGTGNVTFDIARAFPQAEVIAVDVTDRSLDIAREKLSQSNFSNIEFRKSNLLEFDEALGTFDLIHSQGVIHHLASPSEGVKNLTRYLRDDGIFYLWVYMALGRMFITEIKEILSLMELDTLDFAEQLKMLNLVERGFPDIGKCGGLSRNPAANLARRNKPAYRAVTFLINGLKLFRDEGILSLLQKTADKFLKHNKASYDKIDEGTAVGLVDTYLNVNEVFFRFDQLLAMIKQSGLKMDKILQGMSNKVEDAFKHDDTLMKMILKLPKEKQYGLIELLEKPSGVGLMCKKV